jgi:hypothetical protein
MAVITVRISDKEKARLTAQAKRAGISSVALVRHLISEKSLATAADLLAEMESLMGEKRLRVKARK